jgi:hypothetical protein
MLTTTLISAHSTGAISLLVRLFRNIIGYSTKPMRPRFRCTKLAFGTTHLRSTVDWPRKIRILMGKL